MEPNPLEATIEELIQKHRTGPLLLTMRQEQGTVWGKPKDDPVVGVRYLFFPRRVFGKVSQIWDIPKVCLALVGEFYLTPKEPCDAEFLRGVPMQPAQWATRVSWWENVTLGGLISFQQGCGEKFSRPFVEFGHALFKFKTSKENVADKWLERNNEFYELWKNARHRGNLEQMETLMARMDNFLCVSMVGWDTLWRQHWSYFAHKLKGIEGNDVLGRSLEQTMQGVNEMQEWEKVSFWYPRSYE